MQSYISKLNHIELSGITGQLARNLTRNWLIGLRETNPALLDMIADRDKKPYRQLLPWSGEFIGKYLTGAAYIYKLMQDEKLRIYVQGVLDELLPLQAADGYLGCYSKECHLTGSFSQEPAQNGRTWDAWSHYHLMIGLRLWYLITRNESYRTALLRIADLFMNTFYNETTGNKRVIEIGYSEMNLSPYHIFALLAADTGDERYLRFAREIEADLADKQAGNYLYYAEHGLEYYQCPRPRWESMHIIEGIAQMFITTGEERYLHDAMQIFESILRTDVHNTGAFSTEEQACGTPFRDGKIETCCVIAYNALAADLYLITGKPSIADFLELSHYNAVLGYYSPTGRWSTYNTPMRGDRCANFDSIHFQCRPGSPELNCCSVNAPRGVGQMADWMLTEQDGTLYLNVYEAFTANADDFSIYVDGVYPAPGLVTIRLRSVRARQLALRIPAWSTHTKLTVDGVIIPVTPGSYALLDARCWSEETIQLDLDFSVRFLYGHEDYEGQRSIYYGPVLYGCDISLLDGVLLDEISPLSEVELRAAKPELQPDGRITVSLSDGITLGDFRMLGYTGATYRTFLPIKNN